MEYITLTRKEQIIVIIKWKRGMRKFLRMAIIGSFLLLTFDCIYISYTGGESLTLLQRLSGA